MRLWLVCMWQKPGEMSPPDSSSYLKWKWQCCIVRLHGCAVNSIVCILHWGKRQEKSRMMCLWSSLPASVPGSSGIWPYTSGKMFRLF